MEDNRMAMHIQPYGKEINRAIFDLMLEKSDLLIFGEDISDPYGGAFAITRGLSTEFPNRVFNTPISEASLFGFCFGVASENIPVVLEIMFGDFVLLAMDQLHNNLSKISMLSNIQSSLVIRTPMGGYRGYGPTHSQTLNRFLVGSENIDVVCSSNYISPFLTLSNMLDRKRISVFIEDKMSYLELSRIKEDQLSENFSIIRLGFPFQDVLFKSLQVLSGPRVLIICVGSMIRLSLMASEVLLIQHEILVDIYQVNSLWPINKEELVKASKDYRQILIVEEGWEPYGISSEIIAILSEHNSRDFRAILRRIGSKSSIIPSSMKLEAQTLPTTESIVEALLEISNKGK